MSYLPYKSCRLYQVASVAAIWDEANCSCLHQSYHCGDSDLRCNIPPNNVEHTLTHHMDVCVYVHDNVMTWRFPCYLPFVGALHYKGTVRELWGVSFPNINQLYPLIILHWVNCRGANATVCRCYMETLPAILVHCEMEFAGHQWILRTKGHWWSDFMSPLMSARLSCWRNTRGAGELMRLDAHLSSL